MRAPVLSLLLTACTGAIQMTPPPAEVPAVTRLTTTPVERPRPERTTQGSWTTPSALWLQAGAVTVLDGAAVKQKTPSGFSVLPIGVDGEPGTTGAVKALSRRGGGVLLAASGGFFHDAPGRLLRAPLSDDFSMETVRFVDVVGAAVWVTTGTEAVRLLDGRREALRVDDDLEPGAVQAVVGRSEHAALLFKGASLYAVDLSAKTVKVLARELGTVTALDRQGPRLLVGTSEGLLEIAEDDVVTLRTLGAVVDVEAVGTTTLVTTPAQVLQLSSTAAVVLADVTHAWPDALTKDASGDVWFLDGASLARLSTSVTVPPPSFAADVKPFITAHCRSCHATGAQYAPQLDLEQYGVAKSWAPRSLTRLTDALAPMPPANTEVLTPAQYDVFVRWVEGGLLP